MKQKTEEQKLMVEEAKHTKRQYISTNTHGVTHKMAAIVIVYAIITSNFRRKFSFYIIINFKDIKINWKIVVNFYSILKLTFIIRAI